MEEKAVLLGLSSLVDFKNSRGIFYRFYKSDLSSMSDLSPEKFLFFF